MNILIRDIRLGKEKRYFEGQLTQFASYMSEQYPQAVRIEFCKQNGPSSCLSISVVNARRCIDAQRDFENKNELLGFVVGFNSAKRGDKL